MKVHIFKCPGQYVTKYGIRYEIASHDVDEVIPDGWFKTIEEAAKACPVGKVFAPKSKKKLSDAERLKKMAGHPSVDPNAIPTPHVEEKEIKVPKVTFQKVNNESDNKDQPKVEVRQYKDLTDEDKRVIKERLESGEKPGEISKDYDIHHLVIAKVGREPN